MKDVSLKLREEYFRLLNGNVVVNAVTIPVYDTPTSSASIPYILIDTFTELNDDDKDQFGSDIIQSIEVVTSFSVGNYGGKKQSDEITSIVKNLIKTSKGSDNFDLSPNFHNITTKLERSNTLTEQNSTDYIVRRIIEFRHLIQEL